MTETVDSKIDIVSQIGKPWAKYLPSPAIR